MMGILPDEINVCICDGWRTGPFCMISLREEYLRRSCRVCASAGDCWPGLHPGPPETGSEFDPEIADF